MMTTSLRLLFAALLLAPLAAPAQTLSAQPPAPIVRQTAAPTPAASSLPESSSLDLELPEAPTPRPPYQCACYPPPPPPWYRPLPQLSGVAIAVVGGVFVILVIAALVQGH